MKQPQPIQISVSQPCSEDWSKMKLGEDGRYCESCQKCVIDFTAFTDEQLYKFIAEHKGQQVCGRLKRTQLNRPLKLPAQPHSTLYKWIMAAGLALVFVASPEGKTFAQAPYTTELNTQANESDSTDICTVKGRVLAKKLKYSRSVAVIDLVRDDTIWKTAITDMYGKFSIEINRADINDSLILDIRAAECEPYITPLNTHDIENIIVKLTPIPDSMLQFDDIVLGRLDPYFVDKKSTTQQHKTKGEK